MLVGRRNKGRHSQNITHYGEVIMSTTASQITTHDCLLNPLFRYRSKKTSKLRVTGLCVGNSPVTGEFPAQRTSNAEMFPFGDAIMLNQDLNWTDMTPSCRSCPFQADDKTKADLSTIWLYEWTCENVIIIFWENEFETKMSSVAGNSVCSGVTPANVKIQAHYQRYPINWQLKLPCVTNW